MAVEREQSGPQRNEEGVLRGRDIIPGAGNDDTDTGRDSASVPEFDLSKQGVARQRQATSVRRKGPASAEPQAEQKPREVPVSSQVVKKPRRLSLTQNSIIAEIVARDIQRLCRCNNESGD